MIDADFEMAEFFGTVDAARTAQGLSWTTLARRVSRVDIEGAGTRPISASTLSGMLSHASVESTSVLALLAWLGRSPESFVPGHPDPRSLRYALPPVPAGRWLRLDISRIYRAVDSQREGVGMTWPQAAREIGGFTPGMLQNLARSRHIGFPRVMRLFLWLDQPAADFTRLARR